jgi:hypothetical protein
MQAEGRMFVVRFSAGLGNLSLLKASRPVLSPNQLPTQTVKSVISPVIKQEGRKADQSDPASEDVKIP